MRNPVQSAIYNMVITSSAIKRIEKHVQELLRLKTIKLGNKKNK